MDNALIKNVLRHIKMSEEESLIFGRFWTEKTLAKGDFLLRNGEICKYDNYVVTGTLKAFYIDPENGHEEILYFAIDDWWATDIDSFSRQKPSIYDIQAIEQTTVLQINYHSFQQMLSEIPALERYFRIILEGYAGNLQRRLIWNNIHDAEYRYFDFLARYPGIAGKVPQYMIASYLGISAEFLSRIRKKHKQH